MTKSRKSGTKKRSLLDLVALSGFDKPQSLIQLFVGGSELHGAKVGQTDDTDIYGVYIEEPSEALGLDSREHFVWSTAGNERRNTADDVDVTLYSLRKWAGMAAKGNATALHFLFAEPEDIKADTWKQIKSENVAFSVAQFSQAVYGFCRRAV